MMRYELPPAPLSRLRGVGVLLIAILVGVIAAHAAKNPDKPEKPDKFDKPVRIDKIERKLERAGLAEMPELPPPMAATVEERPVKSERSARMERTDGAEQRSAAPMPADPEFDGFRIVLERNIFNPNRVARTRTAPEEKPPRIDEISLVGTMQSDKGLIAFFDSTDSDYRKNLREGESIAGFKLKRIAADGVELERGGEPTSLKVAQQLRRTEGGEWSVNTTPSERAETRKASSSDSARSAAAAAAAEIPADASEALKRLMQQRQKQSK